MSRIDYPLSRDLFDPMGPAADAPKDPNAQLWLSIRPGPLPAWPARLRGRAAALWREAASHPVSRRWRVRLASYPTAQDRLSSAFIGLLLGLGMGLTTRPIILELAARSGATGGPDRVVLEAPRTTPAPLEASRSRPRRNEALRSAREALRPAREHELSPTEGATASLAAERATNPFLSPKPIEHDNLPFSSDGLQCIARSGPADAR